MLEALVGGISTYERVPIPAGQATWESPGTFQWVCPEDVTEVSAFLIGPGQQGSVNGTTADGGYGGGSRWKNKIPTVPGATYTIVVASAGGTAPPQSTANIIAPVPSAYGKSSAFGIMAGNYDQGTTLIRDADNGGGKGGSYSSASGSAGATAYGGTAGRLTVDGVNGASGFSGGTNVKTGAATNRSGFSAGVSGGGGIAVPKASNGGTLNAVFLGAHGAVRLIWGDGRKYPSTRITDE